MTKKKYLECDDATCTATVTAVGGDEAGHFVCLNVTIFHPQGGGQKSDRGVVGGARVSKAILQDGAVRHYLDNPVPFEVGQPVDLAIDENWRRINSLQHTAGHLIAAVVEEIHPGVRGVKGHHFPREGYVEFEGADLPAPADVALGLAEKLEQVVSSNLPIRVEEDAAGVRQVGIGHFLPAIPCGGTHLKRTGEIGRITIRGIKVKGGRLRIGYDVEAALPPAEAGRREDREDRNKGG
jgi:alanyl-tRNA synthetase